MTDNMGFVEGAEVVVTHGLDGFPTLGRVYRVYKNGRFLLRHAGIQYRPTVFGQAIRCGEKSYMREHVRLLTPEIRTQIEKRKREILDCATLRELAERLFVLSRKGSEAYGHVIDDVNSLLAKMQDADA